MCHPLTATNVWQRGRESLPQQDCRIAWEVVQAEDPGLRRVYAAQTYGLTLCLRALLLIQLATASSDLCSRTGRLLSRSHTIKVPAASLHAEYTHVLL